MQSLNLQFKRPIFAGGNAPCLSASDKIPLCCGVGQLMTDDISRSGIAIWTAERGHGTLSVADATFLSVVRFCRYTVLCTVAWADPGG